MGRLAETRSLAVPLWTLTFVALALFLREARSLFVPIAIALLAAYAFEPALRPFDAWRVPRSLSAAVLVIVIFATAGLVGWSLSDDVANLVRELPSQVRELRQEIQTATRGTILENLTRAPSNPPPGSAGTDSSTSSTPSSSSGTSVAADYLWQGSTSAANLLGQIVVIAFLTYFLLVGATPWHQRLVRMSGDVLSSRRMGAEVLKEITQQIQRFLLMRIATAIVVGAATFGALLVFGGPAPVAWGIAAGVFNSVPYFGPLIVSGGLLIVGFVAGGLTLAVELSLSALVITSLEGWLLTPLLLGRATRMNTLAVFLSLLFWSWVWGIWGTILAIPVTTVIKSVADHVDRLDWLAALLSEDEDTAS